MSECPPPLCLICVPNPIGCSVLTQNFQGSSAIARFNNFDSAATPCLSFYLPHLVAPRLSILQPLFTHSPPPSLAPYSTNRASQLSAGLHIQNQHTLFSLPFLPAAPHLRCPLPIGPAILGQAGACGGRGASPGAHFQPHGRQAGESNQRAHQTRGKDGAALQ